MHATRSFVDLFSNNSVIRGLAGELALLHLFRDHVYPADCLPQFLHESTHHWCFQSPVCVALAFLPGPLWLLVAVPALAFIASVGTVLIGADDIRAARLHQHGLEVPDDIDLGRPPH